MSARTEYVEAVDERGQRTQLIKIIPRISTSSFDGPGWVDGRASVKTLDGEQCTPTGDGTFQAIHTNRKFTLA